MTVHFLKFSLNIECKMLRNAENAERCWEMQINAEKCREMQWTAEKWREMKSNAEKCREM